MPDSVDLFSPPPTSSSESFARAIKIPTLAHAAGVERTYLNHIVAGRVPPSPSAAVRLALSFEMCHRSLNVAKARHDAERVARSLGFREPNNRIGAPLPPHLADIPADEAAEQLEAMLRARQIPIRVAAIEVGISSSAIEKILMAKVRFTAESGVRLARLLGLPPDYFLALQAAARADTELAEMIRRQDIVPLPVPVRADTRRPSREKNA